MTDSLFEDCINRICSGDKGGLRKIYEEYGKFIYSVMLSVTKEQYSAEDLTSDFFLKLWDKLADTFKGGRGHKKWLAAAARNMAVDYIRKNRREMLTLDEEYDDETVTRSETLQSTDDTESSVIGNITVSEALNGLSDSEREVLELKLVQGLTFKDIALILKKPMGTVAWKYRAAAEKLRKNLEGGAAL
ncbi:MAG: RNA polymerase sigma factor [Oscillospiraceae bacterium]